MKHCLTFLLGFALAIPLALGADPMIDNAWARATPPGATTAAIYLDIISEDKAERLLGGKTSVAREVQIHTHVHENGMMSMQQIDSLPVHGKASLKPHGDHLMLVGLVSSLKPGSTLELTLWFEQAGEVTIDLPVLDGRKRSTP